MDQALADDVAAGGCQYCDGTLHSARYPRKPRGAGAPLDETYHTRLSFCCAVDGCRRRHTPPSVRFLGRKVYLGTMVVLLTALQHGLTSQRRRAWIERLDIPPQTLVRWRRWWREVFPETRCWREVRSQFLPPVPAGQLPGALLGRLTGGTLLHRLCQLLQSIAPVTTAWSRCVRGEAFPQTM